LKKKPETTKCGQKIKRFLADIFQRRINPEILSADEEENHISFW